MNESWQHANEKRNAFPGKAAFGGAINRRELNCSMNRNQQPLGKCLPLYGVGILCIFLLTACSDPGDPLPGGYSVFVASNSEIMLVEPKYGGSVPELDTDLQSLGNFKEYIYGESGSNKGTTPGFFLLNTTDGSVKAGLSEADWLKELGAAGIPSPPELTGPARKRPISR